MNIHAVMIQKLIDRHLPIYDSKQTNSERVKQRDAFISELSKEIVYLLRANVRTRVAYALAALCSDGKPIKVAQGDIGFQMDVGRSSISTIINEWKRNSLMHHTGRSLFIDNGTMMSAMAHDKKIIERVHDFFQRMSKKKSQLQLPLKEKT